jgi:hypothetical protein
MEALLNGVDPENPSATGSAGIFWLSPNLVSAKLGTRNRVI